MIYNKYKSSRDASWKILIQQEISSLPVDLKKITGNMSVAVKKDNAGILTPKELGRTMKLSDGKIYIIVRDMPVPQKRYTIAHEIGHIVLGHMDMKNTYDEYSAERFAIDLLAPACVLWGLGLHSPEDIAKFCNISISSARIRAERMSVLYKRNKFLTSPLERQVYEQFKDFIEKNRK